jgi:hypothetical protein
MGKCSGKLGRFPFSFFPKGALTPHRPQAGGGSPVGARALSEGERLLREDERRKTKDGDAI